MVPALPVDQLASERGFAHLARTGEVNQFLGLIGLQSIIKAAFHARFFRPFKSTLQLSRDFYSKF
jgi:hypothetical protein